MSLVLPSTVEELNYMQNTLEFQSPPPLYVVDSVEDLGHIGDTLRNFKREYSLPNGVVEWNVHDFEPYLNFEENASIKNLEVINSHEDRRVPGEEQRQRSESISSVSSSMDDKTVVYRNMGIKTYSTLCMDSGSTCISSDNSYIPLTVSKGLQSVETSSDHYPLSVYKDLESVETFQNLNQYITQGPEIHTTDTISSISSASCPLNDNLDYSILSSFSAISNNSNDSYSDQSISLKRSASPEDDFLSMSSPKQFCESPDSGRYQDVRKKNNIASKNCRKTRKEKQKDMETRVTDLEKEREELKNKIRYLETATAVYKKHIHAIMKPCNGLLANGIANNNTATTSVSNNGIPS